LPSQIGLTVSSLADSGPGSLRAAIQTAHDDVKSSDQYTIGFSVSGTIKLQCPLPDLTNSIAIQGPGEDNLTVQQAAASFSAAILTVDAGQTANLSGLTITNANHNGIQNSGTLTISGCTLSGNSAAVDVLGGAIDNVGTMTISDCTL